MLRNKSLKTHHGSTESKTHSKSTSSSKVLSSHKVSGTSTPMPSSVSRIVRRGTQTPTRPATENAMIQTDSISCTHSQTQTAVLCTDWQARGKIPRKTILYRSF